MKLALRFLAIALFAILFASLAHAQTANDSESGLPAFIPVQYQIYALAGVQIMKWLAELYSSVRNGGGLKRIIMAFWFGENLPKVVATDYQKELTTPPVPPKT